MVPRRPNAISGSDAVAVPSDAGVPVALRGHLLAYPAGRHVGKRADSQPEGLVGYGCSCRWILIIPFIPPNTLSFLKRVKLMLIRTREGVGPKANKTLDSNVLTFERYNPLVSPVHTKVRNKLVLVSNENAKF